MSIDWSKQKVLICGGAGMIGSHLARTLSDTGSEVTIADNLSSGSKKNIEGIEVKFFQYDLRDNNKCKEVVKGQDYIFQLAANMGGIGYITSIGADIMYDSAMINLNMLDAYVVLIFLMLIFLILLDLFLIANNNLHKELRNRHHL